MIRSSCERGRVLALLWLCSCTPNKVLDAVPTKSASRDSQPMAAGNSTYAADVPQQMAASAGRAAQPLEQPQASSDGPQAPRPLPARLLGVTLTRVYPLDTIVEALSSLSHKPSTRVVFDVRLAATAYIQVLQQIAPVSFVMGEPVDSVSVEHLSVEDYAERTTECLDALSEYVDIWEIGNEVNGEWLGPSDQVRAKIVAAYQLVRERGRRTALTLYFNQGCAQQPDNELFTWAASNIPQDMRQGLDYVWLSYYEQRCHRAEPDWTSVFRRLHELFPHSQLGFGGVGTSDASQKAELVRHFYSLNVPVPSFVGGYFWWYFRDDMLPAGAPLWEMLNQSWPRTTL